MREPAPQTIFLKDYTPFGYIVEDVHLTFKLAPRATRVISRMRFAPNPEASDNRFFLHGEQLDLKWAKINGADIAPSITPEGLTTDVPEGAFRRALHVRRHVLHPMRGRGLSQNHLLS